MDKSNLKEADKKREAKKVKPLRAAAIAILGSLKQLQSQEEIRAYDQVRMPSTKQFKEVWGETMAYLVIRIWSFFQTVY